ncbi:MAG: TIM barrel protein, partial [Chloroflexi bacterium]|nr:TIM barrel protein [Chloroflexota bacterium]
MSLDAFCRTVADIGYEAIEFFWPGDSPEDTILGHRLPEIVETARRHGLVVASMSGHRSLPDGLNQAANHDRIEAELRRTIDLAAEHGIGGLICFSGNRNPRQSDLEGMIVCAEGLRRIAPYAEQKGINLNIELLNSRVDHPGYQCDHTEWGVALCEMVNSPRVKLLFDIYHMQIMEGDVIRSIQKHIRWIGHFHTAGNPGRRDMDDAQELNYRGIARAIA